jgi:hypothetical protein
LADSGLFLAEQLEVDGVGVVGLQELAALAIEAQQFSVKLLKLVDGLALAGGDLDLEGGPELGEPGVGELDAVVELLDLMGRSTAALTGSFASCRVSNS